MINLLEIYRQSFFLRKVWGKTKNPIWTLFILLFVHNTISYAQTTSNIDCGDAEILCNAEQIVDAMVPNIPGLNIGVDELENIQTCLLKQEFRPYWYKFTAASSGPFEFAITPYNSMAHGDWDFVLFDLSDGCNLNSSHVISCNFSKARHQPTGISSINQSNWIPDGVPSNPWNPTVYLQAGNTYAIFIDAVENYPASFKLEFNMNNLPGAADFIDVSARFTADKNNVCVGETIHFSNHSTFPSGSEFSWDFGDGHTANTQNASHAFSAPGTYDVILNVYNTSCGDSDTLLQIEVTESIIPDFSYTNHCQNDTLEFTSIVQGNPDTYAWNFGSSATPATASGPGPHKVVFSSPGPQPVTLSVSNTACAMDTTKTVDITPLPVINISASPLNICLGESSTLSASGLTDYQWIERATGQIIDNNTDIIVSPSVSASYIVIGTDAFGCENRDTIDIGVNMIPTATATADKDTICAGEGVEISVIFNPPFLPATANAYSFDNGNTFQNSSSRSFPNIGSDTTISVVVADANGCLSEAIEMDVALRQPLIPDFNVDNACLGSPITVTNASSGNPTGFSWTFAPDADLPNANTEGPHSVLFTSEGTKTITLTITNPHCPPESVSKNIEIRAIPALAINSSDNEVCEGESLAISATGADTYQWIDLNTGTIIGNDQTITVTPATSGSYAVIGTDAFGCENRDTIDIGVNMIPTATATADKDTVCAGEGVEVSVIFNPPFLPATANAYSFDNGNTFQNTGSKNFPNIGSDTTISVVVADANGCLSEAIEMDVALRQPLIPDFNVDNACLGSPITVTNASSGNPTGFSWTFAPDADLPNANTEGPHSVLFTSEGTKTITLTITNPHCPPESVSKNIEIRAIPALAINSSDNEVCEGESLAISATGADTYQWIDLNTGTIIGNDQTITVTPATSGSYAVIGTDAFGCENRDTIDIGVNMIPTATATADKDTICAGEGVEISVIFNPPFLPATANAYSFDNGNTFQNSSSRSFPNIGSDTTISVVVADANGCLSEAIEMDVALRQPLIPDFNVDNACLGSPITVTNASSGNPTGFSWTFAPDADLPNANTEGPHSVLFASEGTKTITLTIDDTRCGPKTITKTIEISNILPVVASAARSQICEGESLSISATGGAAYQWIDLNAGTIIGNGQTITVTPATSGSYAVIGTDAFGCENRDTIDIGVNMIPTATATADKDTVCAGEGVEVSVIFNPPFLPATANAYSFDNGNTFQNSSSRSLPNIGSDTTISVVVADANGCLSETIEMDVALRQPLIPDFNVDNACLGSPITVTNASSGNPTEFSWTFAPDADLPNANTEGPHSVLFASEGTKTITLTIDDTRCGPKTITKTIEISYILPVVASAARSQICEGESLSISATGGASYQWIDLNAGTIIGNDQTITLTPTTSGSYAVIGTDAFGCENRDTIDIGVNMIPTATATADKDTVCAGEDVNISVIFNPPFLPATANAYSFDNGNTFQNTGSKNFPNIGSDTTISVVVADANGCLSEAIEMDVALRQPLIPDFNVDNACLGSPITITNASSGSPTGFSWTFAPDADLPNANTEGPHSVLFTSEGTKTITLTITNAYCDPQTIVRNIKTRSGIPLTLNADNTTICEGSSIRLTSTGADTYTWHTSSDMTQIATGPELTITATASSSFSVIGSDSEGCADTLTISIVVNPQPGIEPISSQTICLGETATISAGISPGFTIAPTGGYSYDGGATWVDHSIYTMTSITDPVTIPVQIKDINGCVSDTMEAQINLKTLTATFTVTGEVLCYESDEGAINISNPGGGVAPYMYSINGGPFGFNPDFGNLTARTHTIEIRDAQMCRSSFQVAIHQPDSLTAAIDSSHSVLCYGQDNGYVSLSPSGGVAPYTYAIVGTAPQSSHEFSNLKPGAYFFQIIDANDCYHIIHTTITEPDTLLSDLDQVTPVSCFNGSDGSISAIAIGGVRPYSYSANGIDYISESAVEGIPAGEYTFHTRDNNGCISTFKATVGSPEALSYSISIIEEPTCHAPTGSFRVTSVSGGTPSYLFSIDGGPQSPLAHFTDVMAGNHTIFIEDSKGCVTEIDYNLPGSDELAQADTSTTSATCFGDANGTARLLNARGGVAPYEFSLDNALYQSSPVFENLEAGQYTIYIRTAESCVSQFMVEVNQPAPILSTITNWTDSICHGAQDGFIILHTTGGKPDYEYTLDGISMGETSHFTDLEAGMHIIEVRDGRGCTGSSVTFNIGQRDAIAANISELLPDTCNKSVGVALVNSVTGGLPPYRYSADGGETFQSETTLANLSAGIMTIIVEDQAGCQGLVPLKIRQIGGIDLDELKIAVKHIECNGINIGEIALSDIVGEHGPYIFALNNEPPKNQPVFTKLPSGNHTVTITGQNGCSMYIRDIIINQPMEIRYEVNTVDETCQNEDGEIRLFGIKGGVAPYSYTLDSKAPISIDAAGDTISGLVSGLHRIVVMDSKQCISGKNVLIHNETNPKVYVSLQANICGIDSSGVIAIDSVTGGRPSYLFSLDNELTYRASPVFDSLSYGDYFLTIQDQLCTYAIKNYYLFNEETRSYDSIPYDTIAIRAPLPLSAEATTVNNNTSGSIILSDIKGGTEPYQTSLDSAAWEIILGNTAYLEDLPTGQYTVYLKDQNNCLVTFPGIEIKTRFAIPNLFTPNGDGANETFYITGLPYRSKLLVVNRWGSVVYRSDNYDNSWDGAREEDGIYYYELELKSGKVYKGWVEIVR